jgi:cytochrome c553
MKRIGLWILLLTCVATSAGLIFATTGNAEYGDIVLNSKSASMKKANVKPVVFPHWWEPLYCDRCHSYEGSKPNAPTNQN